MCCVLAASSHTQIQYTDTINIPPTSPLCLSLCIFSVRSFHPQCLPLCFLHFYSISFFYYFLSPAVQSENASLILISSGVVLLFFPWPGPLILQLAPVGSFQQQPLFFSSLYSGPRSCIAPQNIMCVMQSSILIEERGIIKAGLILLCQNHNTRCSCRVDEWFSFLSAGKVFFLFFFLFSAPLFLPLLLPFILSNPLLSILLLSTFLHFMLHLSLISLLFLLISLTALLQPALGDR